MPGVDELAALGGAATLGSLLGGGGGKQQVAQTSSISSAIQFNPVVNISSPESRLRSSAPLDFSNPVSQSVEQAATDTLPNMMPSLRLPAFGPATLSDGSLAGSPEFALATGQSGPQKGVLRNPVFWVVVAGLGAATFFLVQ